MKVLDTDWRAFLQVLERYRRLPYGARKFLVEQVRPRQPVSLHFAGEWQQALVESGLMVLSPTHKNMAVDQRFRGFSRALRACHRCHVLTAPSRDTFADYVAEVLDGPEIAAFSGAGNSYYYYRDYHAVQGVYGRVCSTEWVKQFLAASSPKWEVPYLSPGHSVYFASTAILEGAKAIIRALAPGGVPVPLAQLPGMCSDVPLEVLGDALLAGFRYLLFFPAVIGEGTEPSVGLWPGTGEKLSGVPPKAPDPVTVAEPFHSPFLVEDMVAVLSACAVNAPRVRANDGQLFEADKKVLLENFSSLPVWLEGNLNISVDWRLSTSIDFLRMLEFLLLSRKSNRVQVSQGANQWLGLTPKQRLKAVLASLRGKHQQMLVPIRVYYPEERDSVGKALLQAYAGAGDEFVRFHDFLKYARERDNPYVSMAARETWYPHGDRSERELEEEWDQALTGFLQSRLVGLGCVSMGRDAPGELCFAPAPPLRFLAGLAEDFEFADTAPGHIVVQPNFDVVFLGPSAKAEAELGRFCERKGRHIGTLFRITKGSILMAAAVGLKAEGVLATLKQYCSGEVPANVEREIKGWFGQYREVVLFPAMLVHCPDRETAARVISAAGQQVVALTETVLEWRGGKPPSAVVKKLREMGVFLREN